MNQNGKRVREPEDAVYEDNLHSHKRYLSEVMASSLNGLSVAEENGRVSSPSRFDPMESPARTDSPNFSREDLNAHGSPMSEDSEECIGYRMGRYCVSPQHVPMAHFDQIISSPTSPVSPHRYQKIVNGVAHPLYPSSTASASFSVGCTNSCSLLCAQTRQRNPESDSRFPPSPSDPVQSADLRRAALLRSLQMRAQPPATPPYGVSVSSDQGMEQSEEESEDASLPFGKTMEDHSAYQIGSSNEYCSQPIRSSSRVRSLLLDECDLNSSVSNEECKHFGDSCSNEAKQYITSSENRAVEMETNVKDQEYQFSSILVKK